MHIAYTEEQEALRDELRAYYDQLLNDDLRDALSVVERQRIIDALERCAGNQTRAAEILGITRATLRRKLRDLGLAAD